MSIKVDRAALLAQLEKVKPALASGGVLPQFSHVWFEGAFLSAYDGGLGIEVDYESTLSGGARGATLLGLLQSSQLKEIEFEGLDDALELKMGRSRAKIATLELEAKVWPFPDKIKGTDIELTETLLEALRRVLLIKAAKPTRTEHFGVTLFPGKKDVAMYGGDGDTIIEVIVDAKIPADLDRTVLPRGFVEQVIKQCEVGATLTIGTDYIAASAKGVTIFSNMLEKDDVSDLPETLGRFVTGKEARAEVPAGLSTLLDRVALLSKDKDEGYVELTTKGKELLVEGRYALGELEEAFTLKTALEPGRFRVLASRLSTALRETNEIAMGADTVILLGEKDCMVVLATKPASEPKTERSGAGKSKATTRGKAAKAATEREQAEAAGQDADPAPRRGRSNVNAAKDDAPFEEEPGDPDAEQDREYHTRMRDDGGERSARRGRGVDTGPEAEPVPASRRRLEAREDKDEPRTSRRPSRESVREEEPAPRRRSR